MSDIELCVNFENLLSPYYFMLQLHSYVAIAMVLYTKEIKVATQ